MQVDPFHALRMENTENLNDQVPSPQVTDIIDIIIKTIDANNFPFQVEQDVRMMQCVNSCFI